MESDLDILLYLLSFLFRPYQLQVFNKDISPHGFKYIQKVGGKHLCHSLRQSTYCPLYAIRYEAVEVQCRYKMPLYDKPISQ